MSKHKREYLKQWRNFNRRSSTIKYQDSDKWVWELPEGSIIPYILKINLENTK